jgi:site-specific DNA-cytosine methylase
VKAATLFSGCGGSDIGLRRAGWKVVYANDNDPHARDTYDLNHAPTKIDWRGERGIVDVSGADIPEADLLWASCPCQPWSALGKRKGALDDRNLFPQYARVLAEMPSVRATAWENVPPLARDPYFERIVRKMRSLGFGVAARLLNAADYGVAQDRERLICVGVRGMTDDEVLGIFPRKIGPRPGVSDVLPDVVRVGGWDAWRKPVDRPAALPMPTVTAGATELEFRRRDGSVSAPTIAELLAVSSFPADFRFPPPGRYTDCHARIGNAVPPTLMFHVAKAIRSALR